MEEEIKEEVEQEEKPIYDAEELKSLLASLAEQQKQFQAQLDRLEPKEPEQKEVDEKAMKDYFNSMLKGDY